MRVYIAAVIMLLLLFAACTPEKTAQKPYAETLEGAELYCLADNKEKAEEIASLYGIELVSCEWGVAVFHTEEDPLSVIKRGEKNGFPAVSLNTKKELMG